MLQVLVAISQKFCCNQKKHEAMQVIHEKKKKEKKREEKSVEKMDKCPRYLNNGYSYARLKKREERKR